MTINETQFPGCRWIKTFLKSEIFTSNIYLKKKIGKNAAWNK